MASTNKPRPRRSKEGGAKRDYRQETTNKIVDSIESGTMPWELGLAVPILPFNAVTGRPYKGMNQFALCMASGQNGFADPRWMTYRQAEERGWQVRRGEKACCVEYWDWSKVSRGGDDDDAFDFGDAFAGALNDDVATPGEDGASRRQPRVFYAYVFNAEQIDGVPKLNFDERDTKNRDAMIDKLIESTGARIQHSNPYPTISYPFYLPQKDFIYLPKKEMFKSADNYYAVGLHELGHWTGHESRLGRAFGQSKNTPEYAREELRAEISSAMMCAELGLGDYSIDGHAAYVEHWLEILKSDKNEIFRAAKTASEICDYLFQFAPQEVLDYRQEIIEQSMKIARECEHAKGDAIETPDFLGDGAPAQEFEPASLKSVGELLVANGWSAVNEDVYTKGDVMVSGTSLSPASGYFLMSMLDKGAWVPVPAALEYSSVEFEDADPQVVLGEIQHIADDVVEYISKQTIAEPATRDEAVEAFTAVRPFMSREQSGAIAAACRGEEKQFFFDRLVKLQKEINDAPKTYDQDGKGDDAVVCFHYFYGGSDWFITELDKEGKGTEQAFGYVCLNGWLDSAELGYISIDEIVENGVELDLHWTPKTLREIKADLHKEHPRVPETDAPGERAIIDDMAPAGLRLGVA